MASEELNSWVTGLRQMGQDLASYRQADEAQKLKTSREALLPKIYDQAVAAGYKPEEAAGLKSFAQAYPEQLPKIYDEIIKKKKGDAQPYSADQIGSLYGKVIDPSEITAVSAIKDRGEQDKHLNNLLNVRKTNLQNQNAQTSQERLGNQFDNNLINGPGGFKTDFVRRVEEPYLKRKNALETAKQALDQGTAPGNAIVVNFIARDIAEEKGPLSEGDVKRVMGDSIEGGIKGIKAYFDGVPISKWTPEQVTAYKNLLQLAEDRMNSTNDEKISKILNRSKGEYGGLYDSKGEPAAAISNIGADYGFEHKGGGKFEKKKPIENNYALSGDYASAGKLAANVKDPARQKMWMEALKQAQDTKHPIDAQLMQQLQTEAGGQ